MEDKVGHTYLISLMCSKSNCLFWRYESPYMRTGGSDKKVLEENIFITETDIVSNSYLSHVISCKDMVEEKVKK